MNPNLTRNGVALIATIISTLVVSHGTKAADLRIDSASLSSDPNADTWHLTSRVCNDESSGHSGSLLYELLLVRNGVEYSIGSTRDSDVLNANVCRTFSSMAIDVNTNVPAGTYDIAFAIGDYNGSQYIERDRTQFNRTLVVGSGSGTGSSDVCARNGWYGDGECDSFCPSPDPDCLGGAGFPAVGVGLCGNGLFFATALPVVALLAGRRRRWRKHYSKVQ